MRQEDTPRATDGPPVIYLEPGDSPERCWCIHDMPGANDHQPWNKYIREDLIPISIQVGMNHARPDEIALSKDLEEVLRGCYDVGGGYYDRDAMAKRLIARGWRLFSSETDLEEGKKQVTSGDTIEEQVVQLLAPKLADIIMARLFPPETSAKSDEA